MIALVQHPQGVVLPVRAQPGARANAIRGIQDGALKVAITQVAEKGKANKALIQLLCKSLHLRRSQVELLTGETSAQKQLLIRDLPIDELRQRIGRTLGGETHGGETPTG